MSTIKNYTPHPITFQGTVMPSDGCARMTEERSESIVGFNKNGVPYASIRYTGVEGLPPDYAETNIIYIVSRPVAEYVRLPHVVALDRFTRDEEGRIIGAEGLCWFPPI